MDINELSRNELIELNRRVIERIEFLDKCDMETKKKEFRIGDIAKFEDPSGNIHECIIIRFNKKTVTVSTGKDGRWNIPHHALKPSTLTEADFLRLQSDKA